MARKRRNAADAQPRAGVSADEKIARLLALLLIKDLKKTTDQVRLLRRAGFEVSEVADVLNVTENHVRVADYRGRKKKAH